MEEYVELLEKGGFDKDKLTEKEILRMYDLLLEVAVGMVKDLMNEAFEDNNISLKVTSTEEITEDKKE